MKTKLNILFLIILVLCLVLPLFANSCVGKYAVIATTMLSGLCGLATLYIAILLYDRYGVESKTKERTLKAIEEAIAEMQKVHFVLCYYSDNKDGDKPTDYLISVYFHSKRNYIKEYLKSEALSSVLYYKSSGMYACSQLTESILSKVFLPKTIAEAVKKLYVFKYDPQNIVKDTRPITTLSAFSDIINNYNDTLDAAAVSIPEQQYSVTQFIDVYFGVKEAIVKWYRENGIDTSDTNMD